MVQFAVDPRDGRDFAVKFFLDEEAFSAEAALYASCFPSLRTHLSPALMSRLPSSGLPSPPTQVHGTPLQQADAHSDVESENLGGPPRVDPGGGGGSPEMETGKQVPSGRANNEHAPSLERDTAPAAGQRHDRVDGGGQPLASGGSVVHANERALRQADAFRLMPDAAAKFLPQVEAVCDDAVDPRGRPLPPCIVMEKGESLQDWSNRAEPDLFTSLAVRQQQAANWSLSSPTFTNSR